MTQKMVPLSVRVTPADAEFIAGLQIDGATTPSDKLRAIIAEERQRREGSEDYALAVALIRDLMQPALRRLRAAEGDANVHSELVARLGEWLPDICGYLVAEAPAPADDDGDLRAFEAGLADRVFSLVDSVLRLAVTRRCRGYDPELIADHIGPTLELAELLLATRSPRPAKTDS